MALDVTPAWADMNKPVEAYDKVSGPKIWIETFIATGLDGSTLQKVTRAINSKMFTVMGLHIKNSGGALQDLQVHTGTAIDTSGDLSGLSSNPSNLFVDDTSRKTIADPTTLADDTECDILFDASPLPPAIQIMAKGPVVESTALTITLIGIYI